MSLRVWLPLNGDLENKGLDGNISLYNNTGAIINENGKIGKCYYFDGVDDWISFNINKAQYSGHPLSFAAWVKCGTARSKGQIIDLAADLVLGYNYDSTYNTINFRYWRCYKNSSGIRVGDSSVTTLTYSPNKWYHVVSVFDQNLNKIYVDGELSQSFDSSSKYTENWQPLLNNSHNKLNIGKSSGDSNWGNMYVNDVRIYDHALSLKQVQQISKGLVLHYKLDNNGMGGQNLLLNSKLDGSWEYPTTSYRDRYSPITVSIPDGDVYTLSFDAKSTVNGDKIRTHYYSPNTTTTCVSSQGVSLTAADGRMDFTLSTSWQRYWVIYNQSETTAVKHVICPRLISGQGTGIVSVKNVKLEKGSIPTPWCPAKSELIDNNIIYDSSGYQNDGIIIGNIQPVNNSPKYITAMHFLATTQKILIQNLITAGFSNSYTFSWWGKTNTFSGKMFWGFADGIRLNGIYNGNLWNTGDGNNNPIYKPGTTTQVTVPSLNTWHHFVMVGNGTSCLVYLDGELWGQAKTYKSISGTKIYFNGWDSGASYTTDDMAMSDFRIYATALSLVDIKELYQTSALIDRNQNLYVRELVE